MKRIINIYWLAIAILMGCQKEDVSFYNGESGISFYLNNNEVDSLNYSFAYNAFEKKSDTLFIKMRLQGYVSNSDRKVKVTAADGTTAKEGVDFILPEAVLKAGENTISYPLVVNNTAKMNEEAYLIKLQVAASEDLKVSALGKEIGNTTATDTYKVWVSNILLKPVYWTEMQSYYGVFSKTKYRFMVQTLGITDFSLKNVGYYGAYNYPLKLRIALLEYEKVNGELIDEFNNRISF
ncbi:DUF4843 domain-containing protein [Pedobacter sp.]|uniref:DUF4843 domain-containing protein n=1 Tax=Pedobacter sp. TaxID=1411316 RepID=UPI003D7F74D2